MFGKGYQPEEVAGVLLYPAPGISEKALGEGPNAANYVGRTVAAASRAASRPSERRYPQKIGNDSSELGQTCRRGALPTWRTLGAALVGAPAWGQAPHTPP